MKKLKLIAGPCVIENDISPFEIAIEVKRICDKLGIEYIFKASYRKANRTKIDSFSGIGDEAALNIIYQVAKDIRVKTITDVHESYEISKVAKYVDNLQIPAFLCRQTDLLLEAGKSGLGVNIKKGQFISPEAMKFPIDKVQSTGNNNIMVCERGTTFGYNDLIVDATAIPRLKKLGVEVVMDCTHSVQKPNRSDGITGGDTEMIEAMALQAIVNGVDTLFMEVHPNPKKALSDAESMLKLENLENILYKCSEIHRLINNFQ